MSVVLATLTLSVWNVKHFFSFLILNNQANSKFTSRELFTTSEFLCELIVRRYLKLSCDFAEKSS